MALADLLSDYGLSKEDINLDIVEATLSSSLNLNFVDPATNTIYYKSLANFATYLKTNELTYSNSTQANVRAAINTDPGTTSGVLLNTEAAFWMFDEFRKTSNTFTALQTMPDIKLSNQLNKNFLKTDSSGKIVKASLTNGKIIKGNSSNEPEEYDILNISAFEATIGIGGDYTDILAAQTAGKYMLKAVGNVTTSNNTTIGNRIILNMNGYDLSTTGYTITITSNKYLEIFNGSITNAGTLPSFIISNTKDLFLHNLTINCNQTGDNAYIADDGILENVEFIVNAAKGNCCLGNNSSYGFKGFARNIILTVNNSDANTCIELQNEIDGLIVKGSASNNSTTNIIFLHGTSSFYPKLTNVNVLAAQNIYIAVYYGILDNINNNAGNIYVKLGNSPSRNAIIQNSTINSLVNNTLAGGKLKLKNVTFTGTTDYTLPTNGLILNSDKDCYFTQNIIINGVSDKCNIEGTFATGKTITLQAGSEYNVINVHTDTDVIYNSGNMTNSIEYLP